MGEFFVYAKQKLLRCLMCEFLGLLLLTFLTGLSTVGESLYDFQTGQLVPDLCAGAVFCILFIICGPTSGAHLNPCVTMVFAILKQIPPLEAVFYIVVQLAGAIAGAATLYGCVPLDRAQQTLLGQARIQSELEWYQALIIDIVITCTFVMVLLTLAEPKPKPGNQFCMQISPAIGVTVLGVSTAAGAACGAAINPAKEFGPAIILLEFTDHYVSWAGPIAGALLGLAFFKLIFAPALVPDKSTDEGDKGDKTSRASSATKKKTRKSRLKSRSSQNPSQNPVIVVGNNQGDDNSDQNKDFDNASRILALDEISVSPSVYRADLDTISRSNVTENSSIRPDKE